MLCKVKPAAIGARRASEFVDDQQVSGPEDNPSQTLQQAAARGFLHVGNWMIRADLIGSDTCIALGLTINSSSPVLALCRALVESGHDTAIALDGYRGDVLCLRVRSIARSPSSRRRLPDAITRSTRRASGCINSSPVASFMATKLSPA